MSTLSDLVEEYIVHQSEMAWSHKQATLDPLVNWFITMFSTNLVICIYLILKHRNLCYFL